MGALLRSAQRLGHGVLGSLRRLTIINSHGRRRDRVSTGLRQGCQVRRLLRRLPGVVEGCVGELIRGLQGGRRMQRRRLVHGAHRLRLLLR